ncbi:MAG: hypothetical protein WD875_19415 [Pirellulales bacterium]
MNEVGSPVVRRLFLFALLAVGAMCRTGRTDDAGGGIDVDAARRERTNPILRPASQSPTARVTAIAFGGTEDDVRLYACGEDKVVRVWSIVRGDGTNGEAITSLAYRGELLWPIYRDRIGAILAMRVFRLGGREYAAIGGVGVKTSQVNLIDVADPERTQVLLHPDVRERRNQTVFALDVHEKSGLLAVGYDAEPDIGQPNAKVLLWRLAPSPKLLHTIETSVSRARHLRLSPDGKKLATAGNLTDNSGGAVEVFDTVSGKRTEIAKLACDDHNTLVADYVIRGLSWLDDEKWQAHTIAGDATRGDDLALTFRPGFRHVKLVGGGRSSVLVNRDSINGNVEVRLREGASPRTVSVPPGKQVTSATAPLEIKAGGSWIKFPGGYRYETWPWILAGDQGGPNGGVAVRGVRDVFAGVSRVAIQSSKGSPPLDENETSGWITAVAVDGSARFVAAASLEAAGPRIRVWDAKSGATIASLPTEEDVTRGTMPINYVRIATAQGARPDSHVLFGVGAFDPRTSDAAAAKQFAVEYPRVLEPFDAKKFTAESTKKRRLNAGEAAAALPKVGANGPPFCGVEFTVGGRKYAAIGYPAGIEVRAQNGPNDADRAVVRKFYGHSAAVTSLDVSSDGDWLLSGSIDGTMCAWSLRGIGTSSELGVKLSRRGEKIVVDDVAAYSPGWEAGFTAGQEIVAVKRAGNVVAKTAWLDALSRPTPGVQLYVEAALGGVSQAMITPVAHDPLWTLYPQRDGNWILWTPQGYFDCSPDAASRFEWHVNLGREATGARTFLAQDFRDRYRKRPVIDALVRFRDVGKALAEAPSRAPPADVAIRVDGISDGGDAPVDGAKVAVSAFGGDAQQPIAELEVWLNGRRMTEIAPQGSTRSVSAEVALPHNLLRPGANMLVAVVATGEADARLNTRRVVRFTHRPDNGEPPRLFYLGVGVTKLDEEPRLKQLLEIGELKYAASDVLAIEKALRTRLVDGGQFAAGEITALAEGGAAEPSRANIEARLEAIAAAARPQDFVVVMLAGHGFDEAPNGGGGEAATGFFFVAKDTTPDLQQTSLTGGRLNDLLSRLPCASLLLLDACHSAAVRQEEQLLDLGGLQLGPQIVTACGRQETSKEHDALKHGLFTYAALEALGAQKASADVRQRVDDGRAGLSLDEFCRYVKLRTPHLLVELTSGEKRGDAVRLTQNPEILSSLTFEASRLMLGK